MKLTNEKWYQTVKNETGKTFKVLDFHKMVKEPNNVWIILSERELLGKTVSAFQFMREKYLSDKHKSCFVLNIEDQFKKNYNKLIRSNKIIYPQMWEKVEVKSTGLYDKKTGEFFCYFYAVGLADKAKIGGRMLDVKYMFYDEFNESLRNIKEKQFDLFITLFMSIFSTRFDGDERLFMFGNTLSIKVPIFHELGIKALPKGDIDFIKHKSLVINFFTPKTSREKQKILKEQKNWKYDFIDLGGKFEKNVVANKLLDNNLGVVPPELQPLYVQNSIEHYLKVGEELYVKIHGYEDPTTKGIYFSYARDISLAERIICFRKRFIENGVHFERYWYREVLDYLGKNQLFFESITVKGWVLNNLVL